MLDSSATAPGGGAATANGVLFAAAAPPYWRARLPAIPLIQGQKRPALNGWQAFCHRMPTESEQAAWLRQFPRGNIGLPLGPAAGIDVADIDTENPVLRRAIEGVLPPWPWHRVGAKGAGLAFRHNGGRPFKIKGADGGMIVEILSTGNQLVMPPSIHPTTLAPYVSDTNLWEVLDELEPLPSDVEGLLRVALADAGAELGGGTGKGSGLPRPEPVRGDGGQRIDGREGWLRDEVWKLVHDPEITSEEQLLERAVEAFDRECAWGATALSATAYGVEDVARKVRAAWAKRERGEVKPNAGAPRVVPNFEPYWKSEPLEPEEVAAEIEAEVDAWLAEPHDLMLRVTAAAGKTRAACRRAARTLRPGGMRSTCSSPPTSSRPRSSGTSARRTRRS